MLFLFSLFFKDPLIYITDQERVQTMNKSATQRRKTLILP